MAAVDPAEKIIDDENRSPAKEYPVVEFPESPVDNGHKRKMMDSDDVAENEAGDAKKQKTEDVEKPTAPKTVDITAEDVVVAEQAEEAKPEENPEDLNKSEKLLEENAPETEITATVADAHDDGDKKEADKVTPVAD